MLTIKDVAGLAGVSKATVSRVLNGGGHVSPETRRRVEKVIEEYGYVPDVSAVNLSRGGSAAVGVIVPEIDNAFYGDVLRGITEVAEELDLPLMFFDTRNSGASEERAIRTLEQYRVRGAILAPVVDYSENAESQRLRDRLSRLKVPVVIVDREFDNMNWDGVFYENFSSSYCAAQELYKAGNRRLGVITGNLGRKIARDRFEGFRQGARDCGAELKDKDILIGDFSVERAYELARDMFRSGDWPEGIFTSNNRTSTGFLKAAIECGIKIGRDIAVIGNDSLKELDVLGIPFSCVMRDNYEMGRTAVRLLVDRLQNPTHSRRISVIPYELKLSGTERRVSGPQA
ncbi:MAG: LacI family DNA-binding transcriptional regulator [Oscillospiraceae bacterium]